MLRSKASGLLPRIVDKGCRIGLGHGLFSSYLELLGSLPVLINVFLKLSDINLLFGDLCMFSFENVNFKAFYNKSYMLMIRSE